MDDIDLVRITLKDNDKYYRQIYKDLMSICRGVSESSEYENVISDIYSRPGSDDNKPEYKEDFKIVEKLLKKSQDISTENVLSLTDLIGLTVVFYYGDEMDGVIASIRKESDSRGFILSQPEKHLNRNGYYATHVIASKEVIGGVVLHCELQFKTMLHDAWAAKMHDLTYKPSGFVDPKTAELMSSIAGTIENLEQQSQLIRDMIKENWDVEPITRREARNQLFHLMLRYRTDVWKHEVPDQVVDLSSRIETLGPTIAADPSSPEVRELMGEIKTLCKQDGKIRTCWILAGRLASLSGSAEVSTWFVPEAERWLKEAQRLLAANQLTNNAHSEVSAVPIMFYVIGDMSRAISTAESILADAKFAGLSAFTRLSMTASLISFKLEREYHARTKDDNIRRQMRDKLEAELKQLLAEESVRGDKDVNSSILDSLGFLKIAFAETPEEAYQGIRECTDAAAIATDKERAISDAYSVLNVKLGWRRFLNLERKR